MIAPVQASTIMGDIPSVDDVMNHLKGLTPSVVSTEGDPDPNSISFKDSLGLKSGKYPKDKIVKLIQASKALGVNPMDSLPIAMQENAFSLGSKPRPRNRGGFGNVDNSLFDDKDNQLINDLSGKGYDQNALKLALALKKKMAYAKQLGLNDEASQLQAYNGLGVITPKQFGGATKAYGVDITNGVDLKKNPLYGKRVIQLRSDLGSNKDILQLMK